MSPKNYPLSNKKLKGGSRMWGEFWKTLMGVFGK